MRCDNCHSDIEAGRGAEMMGFSFSPETPQQKGKMTVFTRRQLSYTPFSVWFCADCIARNRRRFRWLIPIALLLDILVVVFFWGATLRHSQFQLPVALLLLLLMTVTFYLLTVACKPFAAIDDTDLAILFCFEINEIRAKKTGQRFHMTLRQYEKRAQRG